MERRSLRSNSAVLSALIVLSIVLAYSNSFVGSFLLDDFQNIVRNPEIGRFLAYISSSSRPITNASFFLNHAFNGTRAAGYHAINLLIHILSALFLCGLVRRTLMLPRFAEKFASHAPVLAALIACGWAVHPLQTAAVTYIIQRAESLMSMMYLLTLFLVSVGSTAKHPHRWYTAAVVACATGMACKPTMASAPLLVLLYDATFLSGSIKGALRTRGALYIALACTWIVLLALLLVPNESSTSAGLAADLISPGRYLITQIGVVGHYMSLLIRPSGMCMDYAWPAGTLDTKTALMAIGLVSIFGVGLWLMMLKNPFGFPVVWFFLVLAPSSSVIPVADYAFDHRVYLPSVGFVTVLVLGAYIVLKQWIRMPVLFALAILSLGVLCGMTYARNMDYRREEIMWRDVVSKRPDNLRAWNNLAVAYSEQNAFEEAMRCYRRVLQAIPQKERERLDRGDIVPTRIISANSFRANYFRAHANLGLLYYRVARDPENALRHYRMALGVDPGNANVRAKLKQVRQELADRESAGERDLSL